MFRSLGANIWDHEMPIRFGGIPLWHRMTVIRLTNGGLVVHSPTRLDLASQEEFQRLGPIFGHDDAGTQIIQVSTYRPSYFVMIIHHDDREIA
jgi:hypothetical protein